MAAAAAPTFTLDERLSNGLFGSYKLNASAVFSRAALSVPLERALRPDVSGGDGGAPSFLKTALGMRANRLVAAPAALYCFDGHTVCRLSPGAASCGMQCAWSAPAPLLSLHAVAAAPLLVATCGDGTVAVLRDGAAHELSVAFAGKPVGGEPVHVRDALWRGAWVQRTRGCAFCTVRARARRRRALAAALSLCVLRCAFGCKEHGPILVHGGAARIRRRPGALCCGSRWGCAQVASCSSGR